MIPENGCMTCCRKTLHFNIYSRIAGEPAGELSFIPLKENIRIVETSDKKGRWFFVCKV